MDADKQVHALSLKYNITEHTPLPGELQVANVSGDVDNTVAEFEDNHYKSLSTM